MAGMNGQGPGSGHEPGTPCWVDALTPKLAETQEFYAGLFGWEMNEQGPDAGGYVIATVGGEAVAAISPLQEGQFPAWNVYFATPNADQTAKKVEAAGGNVVAAPFEVLDAGRMGVFQDPVGAFFSVWETKSMPGFGKSDAPNTFGWCELNALGADRTEGFYAEVFGWETKKSPGGDGAPPYTEWQLSGRSIGGAMDLGNLPGMEDVPPFWLVYFLVEDIEAAAGKVRQLGGSVQKDPQPYPGGSFAIVSDPAGAPFGLMQTSPGD